MQYMENCALYFQQIEENAGQELIDDKEKTALDLKTEELKTKAMEKNAKKKPTKTSRQREEKEHAVVTTPGERALKAFRFAKRITEEREAEETRKKREEEKRIQSEAERYEDILIDLHDLLETHNPVWAKMKKTMSTSDWNKTRTQFLAKMGHKLNTNNSSSRHDQDDESTEKIPKTSIEFKEKAMLHSISTVSMRLIASIFTKTAIKLEKSIDNLEKWMENLLFSTVNNPEENFSGSSTNKKNYEPKSEFSVARNENEKVLEKVFEPIIRDFTTRFIQGLFYDPCVFDFLNVQLPALDKALSGLEKLTKLLVGKKTTQQTEEETKTKSEKEEVSSGGSTSDIKSIKDVPNFDSIPIENNIDEMHKTVSVFRAQCNAILKSRARWMEKVGRDLTTWPAKLGELLDSEKYLRFAGTRCNVI